MCYAFRQLVTSRQTLVLDSHNLQGSWLIETDRKISTFSNLLESKGLNSDHLRCKMKVDRNIASQSSLGQNTLEHKSCQKNASIFFFFFVGGGAKCSLRSLSTLQTKRHQCTLQAKNSEQSTFGTIKLRQLHICWKELRRKTENMTVFRSLQSSWPDQFVPPAELPRSHLPPLQASHHIIAHKISSYLQSEDPQQGITHQHCMRKFADNKLGTSIQASKPFPENSRKGHNNSGDANIRAA